MPSQGPRDGGSFTNDASVGATAWTSPGGAQTSNDVHAVCALLLLGDQSQGLRATRFGFSIPAGATIDGIVVEMERSVVVDGCSDISARIVKASVPSGGDKASGPYPGADAYITYGSPTDLWGVSWIHSDINSNGFGFQHQAENDSGDPLVTPRVDHIRITVYYTPAGGPQMTMIGVGI